MKFKSILYIPLLLLLFHTGHSQAPDWKVNPSQFNHSMTVVGVINMSREESRDTTDKVAAFINGECRGVATPIYQEKLDRYFVYLLVHNNESKQKVSFKFFKNSQNKIVDAVESINFVVDSLAGGVDAPYVWSDIVLNNKAELKNVFFAEQLSEARFQDSSIYIAMKNNTDLTKLVAEFKSSEGCSVWANYKKQLSGSSVNDFTHPVKYSVFSEDGKQKKDYWIKAELVAGWEDNSKLVIYPNPATKTLFFNFLSDEPQVNIIFTSALGQTHLVTSLVRERGNISYQLNISDLQPGIYFVHVYDKQTISTKKLVVK